MGEDMWDCSDLQSAEDSYLAREIWKVDAPKAHQAIENIFFHDDLIVVHKKAQVEWQEIETQILEVIHGHFASGCPLFKVPQGPKEEIDSDPEDEQIVELIQEVMRDYIQPSVAAHGGLVKLRGFRAGVIKIAMMGACAGCPSSEATLKGGIENILKFYVPTLNRVELVE